GTNDTRRAADELAALPALVTDAGTAHELGAGDLGDAPDAADTAPGPLAAALVPVPYYTRPSEDGVVAHFAHLARRSPVPLLVYHIPYRTGRPLSADTLRRLARLPGVVGVKLAVGGIDQATVEFLADCAPAANRTEPAGPAGPADLSDPSDTAIPPGFAVLAGDDMFCAPLLALGAAGGILASAHIATSVFADLATAWDRGETARACALGHALTGLSAALFAEPNPVVIKAVLAAQGRIPSAAVRLPLLPATPAAVDRALAALTTTEHTAATHVPA
ncbi:MAG: hypothetical protein HOV68_19970, partial [Streptomycetaceae bacterium]|nr:hypothetical protein [Streptomycetaceae bacterium]